MKWPRSFRWAADLLKRCPETMLVGIGDRESDIYELFLEATRALGPALLVRAEKTRYRKVGQEFTRDVMAQKALRVLSGSASLGEVPNRPAKSCSTSGSPKWACAPAGHDSGSRHGMGRLCPP